LLLPIFGKQKGTGRGNAKRHSQVFQCDQGLWFHHPRGWRKGRVRSRQRYGGGRPARGDEGRIRSRPGKEGSAGQRREAGLIPRLAARNRGGRPASERIGFSRGHQKRLGRVSARLTLMGCPSSSTPFISLIAASAAAALW